ncbi:Glutathione S-transferase Mu 3 [Porphyridium purpureum]|uniref:glutathione transferase n=1 Tax=Porphyridium purpureum TaxID=35688 RepID=A0A5J4YMV9_PORPP|nr:Glutathione S-transferase Mu 3 [Porphyridium purpureum]|eukprot:POR1288..scf222_8
MAVTLGYWHIRGLGQPIRYLCEVGGIKYSERLYTAKILDDGQVDCSDWLDEKETLGLDFPNLPYLIDDASGLKLTQTGTILEYLARRCDKLGEDPAEQIRVRMVWDVTCDLRTPYIRACYGGLAHFEATRSMLVEKQLPAILARLEKYLDGHEWVAQTKHLTYVDLVVYDLVDQFAVLDEDLLLKPFPNLAAHRDRVAALPAMVAYRQSSAFIDRPFNNPFAAFK